MNARIKKLIPYLIARLKEPTSVAGYILAIGAALGKALNPEVVGGVTVVLAGLVSAALYVFPEVSE